MKKVYALVFTFFLIPAQFGFAGALHTTSMQNTLLTYATTSNLDFHWHNGIP